MSLSVSQSHTHYSAIPIGNLNLEVPQFQVSLTMSKHRLNLFEQLAIINYTV